MREKFERYRERAGREEREAIWRHVWDRFGGAPAREEGSRAVPGRRLAWAAGAAGVLAAILIALWVSPERPGPPQVRVDLDGPAAGRTVDSAGSVAAPAGPAGGGDPAPRPEASLGAAMPSPPDAAAPPPPTGTAPTDGPLLATAEAAAADSAVRDSVRLVFGPERRVEQPQRGTIAGTVTNRKGEALAYVNVLVEGTPWGGMSDSLGRFTIRDVPAGTYSLRALIIGYAQQTRDSVRVEPAEESQVDFALNERDATTVDLVEITAAREVIKRQSSSLRPGETAKDVGSGADAMGLKGGVVAREEQLHFRGGRSGEVRVQVDRGTRMAPPEARSAPAPQPPSVPITGGTRMPNDEPYDAMFFQHYGVNPFVPTDEDSLSTFGLDVDTGSYTVARRYIDLGNLPPQDAPRVEEFVNFFPQGYDRFHGPDFRILVDGAPSPFGRGYHLLRIGLKAREVDEEDRRPARLVFVIDVSGSMEREHRLELVKDALHVLLDGLTPDDRIGIVTYETIGRVVLEPAGLEDRREIERQIDALYPRGSTNLEEGLRLGYAMARRMYHPRANNRIILCTDGVANVGATGHASILESVRGEADDGIRLTAIGVGMGNYNDVLLEQLADRGDGSYHYVDGRDEARRLFRENLTGVLQTIAADAKVQVAFDPREVLRWRLLGYENRDVADRDFRNDRVDAGEIGAGHEVTALYEVKLAGADGDRRDRDSWEDGGDREGREDREDREDRWTRRHGRSRLGTVRLRYARPGNEGDWIRDVREMAEPLRVRDLAVSIEDASPYLLLDAVAAEFAEILRGSYWAKESRISDLLPLADRAARTLGRDQRVAELPDLLRKAIRLKPEREWEEEEPEWDFERFDRLPRDPAIRLPENGRKPERDR